MSRTINQVQQIETSPFYDQKFDREYIELLRTVERVWGTAYGQILAYYNRSGWRHKITFCCVEAFFVRPSFGGDPKSFPSRSEFYFHPSWIPPRDLVCFHATTRETPGSEVQKSWGVQFRIFKVNIKTTGYGHEFTRPNVRSGHTKRGLTVGGVCSKLSCDFSGKEPAMKSWCFFRGSFTNFHTKGRTATPPTVATHHTRCQTEGLCVAPTSLHGLGGEPADVHILFNMSAHRSLSVPDTNET
jgi:hypothetical protein